MKAMLTQFISNHRKTVLIVFDILVETICYIVPWILIQGRVDFPLYFPLMVASCFFFVCCYEIVYWLLGMYDSLWRYAEVVEFFRLVLASLVAVALFILGSIIIFYDRRVPLSVYSLSAIFATSVTLYSRLTYRMYRNKKLQHSGQKKQRVLVVGAGEAAATLMHEHSKDPESMMSFICVVDDAQDKVGRYIYGVEVMGTTDHIPDLVDRCEIDIIIIAITSLNDKNRQRILTICNKTTCKLQMLPDLRQLMVDGGDLSSRVREVRVEDLLGRNTVQLSGQSNLLVAEKVVLVTGGGGSIGSELCRQIAFCKPKKLIILDIYENNAYDIQQELVRKYGNKLALEVRICSVRDSKKMDALFAHFKPQVVFHAAAHKHVPLMEDSPEEAVKNNVFGTYNTALSADKYGVERFVLISTDKAVNPTNVMGATKRLGEMVVQCMAQRSKTTFVSVRFGNVLGSNGSVLPLFKEQIEHGGPLTVTHPDVVRYFMTIPEAVALVLEAGSMGRGGEIFVLDMGDPVRILDLAENLIKLAGFVPYTEMKIQFTGLRPGEKLYEELLMDEEGLLKTGNDKIFIGAPLSLNKNTFFDHLKVLKEMAYANNKENLVQALIDLVPTYQHESRTQGE